MTKQDLAASVLAADTIEEAHAAARAAILTGAKGRAKAPKAVAAPSGALSAGEAFYLALIRAKRAATEALGAGWAIAGGGTWAEIPARLRSFRTDRGTVIKMPGAMRVPVAKFWTELATFSELKFADPISDRRIDPLLAGLAEAEANARAWSDVPHFAAAYAKDAAAYRKLLGKRVPRLVETPAKPVRLLFRPHSPLMASTSIGGVGSVVIPFARAA